MSTIQRRLLFERKKRNLTQKEFAQVIDMDQSQYSMVENGKLNLTVEKMAILHKKLGIDLNFLITGEYTKLDFGIEKMDVKQLKKLNSDIFNELEQRIEKNLK
ncbi:MAG: helix-turn-helix transcriptional regulator [Bacilli bacterium]|uniref:helix-turn-helix domain-containing protein n=1 Tax=Algoriella sp. TaxID=1872434 RepID=UPI002FC63964